MRHIIACILMLSIIVIASPAVGAYDESTLPPESAPKTGKNAALDREDTVVFSGYINSKEVMVVADVMGCIFYLCKSSQDSFCSDEQGVLILGGDDTGPVVDLAKKLDEAIESKVMVQIYLTREPYVGGVRKVVGIQMNY